MTILFAITGLIWAGSATPYTGGIDIRLPNLLVQQPDTTKDVPPVDLKYEIKDASGNPLLEEEENRGLDLNDPSNLDYSAEYDYKTGNVTIYRKVGNMDVRLPYTMPLEDYMNTDTRRSILSYWREKQNESAVYAEGGSSLLNPSWNVGGEAFESIFGSNKIDVRLQGMAELKVGINRTKLDNPTLQERMRKTTTFDFQEMIQMNITGTIGDKLKLGVNYNTEATFDFENQINLEYEGNEDDILKKVEAGNVTLPLPGTLITGSQSLFGVKTEMQFGKLTVTSIFSQQKGETKVMNIEGGAEAQEFEIQADQYDRNRHFFLAHHFREGYNKALEQLPYITSNTTIQQIEVWVTNRTGNVTESRNVVAFLDLAETDRIRNKKKWSPDPDHSSYPVNASNNLYKEFDENNGVRDINQVTGTLAGEQMNNGVEFEKLENARRLSETEYTLNKDLGYISLNSALNADEVLAVAYRYSVTGDSKEYQVGEFSSKQNDAEKNLYLKLLKSTNLTPAV
ncbi:MAG: cell surface protein SprA, partial [Marinilabiliaceae bacterium]|nr:cell surface protein SprA [Marinilabiliaceae bacterium]